MERENYGLTKEQALKIKQWRVGDGYSWRAVAREVSNIHHLLKAIQ